MDKIYISPKRIAVTLSVIVLCLTAAHVLGQYYKDFAGTDPFLLKIVDKLDLDGESNNLPNWYQSSTLLLSSIVLAIITLIKRAENDFDARYWGFLSFAFLYLSLDEQVSIHEQATMPLRNAFHLNGIFFLSWVIPAAIFVTIFAICYFKFLWRLDNRLRWLMILAGSVYVLGAVGVEMADAKYLQLHEDQIIGAATTGIYAFKYSLMTATEELFEMSGIVIFIYALLSHLMPKTAAVKSVAAERFSSSRQTQIVLGEPALSRARVK